MSEKMNSQLNAPSSRKTARRALQSLVITALMAALGVVLRLTIVYVGGNDLRISFIIVPIAFTGMLLGAPYAAAAGVLADILGYFLFPSGGSFFPGFTLTAALEGLVCGLVLHKKPQSLPRILLCTVLLAVPLHGFLNNLWHAFFLNPVAYFPTLWLRLFKETLLLPLYALIFWLLARFALPPVQKILDRGK